jgi:hypothetical protein
MAKKDKRLAFYNHRRLGFRHADEIRLPGKSRKFISSLHFDSLRVYFFGKTDKTSISDFRRNGFSLCGFSWDILRNGFSHR